MKSIELRTGNAIPMYAPKLVNSLEQSRLVPKSERTPTRVNENGKRKASVSPEEYHVAHMMESLARDQHDPVDSQHNNAHSEASKDAGTKKSEE